MRKDLTGLTFGNLAVIGYAGSSRDSRGDLTHRWWCWCSCGGEAYVEGRKLAKGHTRSCGHIKRTDSPTYSTVHSRLNRNRGKASEHTCPCGRPAKEWSYDHLDPDEIVSVATRSPMATWTARYSADLTHYVALCESCHTQLDWAPESSRARVDSKSGVRGVYRRGARHQARATWQGRCVTFGTFDTIPEADAAATAGRAVLFGAGRDTGDPEALIALARRRAREAAEEDIACS